MARVVIGCESSGTVREAFRKLGHDAISVDLLPADDGSPHHHQGDLLEFLGSRKGTIDLLIAHPPCTDLAVSGARWFPEKRADGRQAHALQFVRDLMAQPVPHICIENPVSIISSHIRKPTQTIQPWQFGHGEVKRTCLWLTNLPPLQPTDIVEGRYPRIHRMPPGPDRWKERSKTYQGIADAMAQQWHEVISN